MIPSGPQKQKVIVIVGPTASGKTALSIALAKQVNGEVVSADSRQVYRGLDIGSGKVTVEEMDGVPHHLLDVADPHDTFTAAAYQQLGRDAIEEIGAHGKVPIIVGGTGFYVDALLGRVSLAEVPPNEELRNLLRNSSLKELQQKLQKLDPGRFETIDTNNPVRLVRAIEIATALGKNPEPVYEALYNTLWIGLTLPQDTLKENIEARLAARLEQGMLEEAKALHAQGVSYERMIELGLEYRFMALHLRGDISYQEMCKQIIAESLKYAKRQMTWFKKNPKIHWLQPEETGTALTLTEDFLAN